MKEAINEKSSKRCAAYRATPLPQNSPAPSTHSDILQIPADLFDVNTAVKCHPTATEKPKQEQRCQHNPGVEVMLAINLPLHLFSKLSRVTLLSIPHLLSGWGSDSATRIKPGYLVHSWKGRGTETPLSDSRIHFFLQTPCPQNPKELPIRLYSGQVRKKQGPMRREPLR